MLLFVMVFDVERGFQAFRVVVSGLFGCVRRGGLWSMWTCSTPVPGVSMDSQSQK